MSGATGPMRSDKENTLFYNIHTPGQHITRAEATTNMHAQHIQTVAMKEHTTHTSKRIQDNTLTKEGKQTEGK